MIRNLKEKNAYERMFPSQTLKKWFCRSSSSSDCLDLKSVESNSLPASQTSSSTFSSSSSSFDLPAGVMALPRQDAETKAVSNGNLSCNIANLQPEKWRKMNNRSEFSKELGRSSKVVDDGLACRLHVSNLPFIFERLTWRPSSAPMAPSQMRRWWPMRRDPRGSDLSASVVLKRLHLHREPCKELLSREGGLRWTEQPQEPSPCWCRSF